MSTDTHTTDRESRSYAKFGQDPLDVPITVIDSRERIADFSSAVASATHFAVDTETYGWNNESNFHGYMRVLTAATRDASGTEHAWLFDARDMDPKLLASALSGHKAIGWNANFDSRVVNDACQFEAQGLEPLHWRDAMFDEALLHAGQTGFRSWNGLAKSSRIYCGYIMGGKGTVQTSFTESDDLTEEQLLYASADAILTLWVYDAVAVELEAAGLTKIAELESEARPFLNEMEIHGFPFDWEGWEGKIKEIDTEAKGLLAELARLTGGGQLDIFTSDEVPTWNTGSTEDLKRQLNKHAPEGVRAYFASQDEEPRLFDPKRDKCDKDIVSLIGGDLAETFLKYGKLSKVQTTYGENLSKFRKEDDRMHPRYFQVVGTATGRLASRYPNAQNFTPMMKPFMKPALPGRVFVYCDLSQAELRDLASISGCPAMIGAFKSGRDMHTLTAESMFSIDMTKLESEDPKEFKLQRGKAKQLNFSIVYGLGDAALANRLTLSDIPTSKEEAADLKQAWLDAYPGAAAWLKSRDDLLADFKANLPEPDLEATLRLLKVYPEVSKAERALKEATGEEPSDLAVAKILYAKELENATEGDDVYADRVGFVHWVRKFYAPVVVDHAGNPISFESRTSSGRRRTFDFSAKYFIISMATVALRSTKPGPVSMRNAFAERHPRKAFSKPNGKSLGFKELRDLFDKEPGYELARDWVDYVLEQSTAGAHQFLASKALEDQVNSKKNAFRNHPIQGDVADIASLAYAELANVLGEFDELWPIQTVHDSITLECWAHDAPAVRDALQGAMERALSSVADAVPAKGDAAIIRNMNEGDATVHYSDEELAELTAQTKVQAA